MWFATQCQIHSLLCESPAVVGVSVVVVVVVGWLDGQPEAEKCFEFPGSSLTGLSGFVYGTVWAMVCSGQTLVVVRRRGKSS